MRRALLTALIFSTKFRIRFGIGGGGVLAKKKRFLQKKTLTISSEHLATTNN